MIVERAGSASSRREGVDRILDLRVDDHPEPIEELRRLLGIWERWHVALASYELYEKGDYETALAETDRALERLGEDSLLLYNRACYASLAGRRDEAIEALARAIELDPGTVEMARADSDFSALAEDEAFLRLTAQAQSPA
jgi:tetratricopeptide (TPR) repeat protein